MILTVVEQSLALVAITIAAALLRRFTRLHMAVASILCGFGAARTAKLFGFDTGTGAGNLQDLVFFIILPVLVFEPTNCQDPRD